MSLDPVRVLANIHADKIARDAVTYAELELQSDVPGVSEDYCQAILDRCWERLAEIAAAKVGKKVVACDDIKMNKANALNFEKLSIPFGRYAGVAIRDIPIGYFVSITESSFNEQLKQYMRSDHFQQRLEMET